MAVVQEEEDRLAAAEAGTARDKREIRNALSLSPGPGQDARGMVCWHSRHSVVQWDMCRCTKLCNLFDSQHASAGLELGFGSAWCMSLISLTSFPMWFPDHSRQMVVC